MSNKRSWRLGAIQSVLAVVTALGGLVIWQLTMTHQAHAQETLLDPNPQSEEINPVIVSISLTSQAQQTKAPGDSVVKSDFDIVTSPDGYQDQVSVNTGTIQIGLNTWTGTLNTSSAQCSYDGVETSASWASTATPLSDETDTPALIGFTVEGDGMSSDTVSYTISGDDLNNAGDTGGNIPVNEPFNGTSDWGVPSYPGPTALATPTILNGVPTFGLAGLHTDRDCGLLMADSPILAQAAIGGALQTIGKGAAKATAAITTGDAIMNPANPITLQVTAPANAGWVPTSVSTIATPNNQGTAYRIPLCEITVWASNPGASLNIAQPTSVTATRNGVSSDIAIDTVIYLPHGYTIGKDGVQGAGANLTYSYESASGANINANGLQSWWSYGRTADPEDCAGSAKLTSPDATWTGNLSDGINPENAYQSFTWTW